MALMFVGSGVIMLVVVLLAFTSRLYRRLSAYYASTSQDLAGDPSNPSTTVSDRELSAVDTLKGSSNV